MTARCPDDQTITGTLVDLVPLAPEHAAALWAAANGGDPHLWDYLPYGPFPDHAAFAAWLSSCAASLDPRFYAIVPQATGQAAGVLALMRCEPDHGVIEIGHVWFGAGLQRTAEATDAVYAAGRHAFATLGHRRLEWKCNADNARSMAAAERFGFTYEGTFRQHMIIKGRNRDTAWFSMLDHEWPAIDAAFQRWIAPENRGADGQQRQSLAALRTL